MQSYKLNLLLSLLLLSVLFSCGKKPDPDPFNSDGGNGTVNTSAYAGTYTGTFSGDDTGSWTFTINNSGKLTGTVNSDSTGIYTIRASVSAAGDLSGDGLTGTVASDGTISGTWPGAANGIGISFSGQLKSGSGGTNSNFGTLSFSGVDVGNDTFGASFNPETGEKKIKSGIATIVWGDGVADVLGSGWLRSVLLLIDESTGEIVLIGVVASNIDGRERNYSLACFDVACDSITSSIQISTDNMVTFADTSIPVAVNSRIENTATGPLVLNGTLSYNTP